MIRVTQDEMLTMMIDATRRALRAEALLEQAHAELVKLRQDDRGGEIVVEFPSGKRGDLRAMAAGGVAD